MPHIYDSQIYMSSVAPTVSGGGGGGRTLIQSIDLVTATPAATHTFSSIPQTYTHLVLELNNLRTPIAQLFHKINVNGDTTEANYSYAFSQNGTGGTGSLRFFAYCTNNASSSANSSFSRIIISNYTEASFRPMLVGGGGDSLQVYIENTQYNIAGAVTSLGVTADDSTNLNQQGRIDLFGID